jgi:hypothetical protein
MTYDMNCNEISTGYPGEGMIRIKDRKQRHLFDPWAFLSPKRRKMLDQGWPGLFRQHLLDELPVEKLAPFFHASFGRPTKELYTVVGTLLFQQAMDLTDTETIEQLSFNIQWHYALDIAEESDEAKTISEKTLWSMRRIMTENNLDEALFEGLTDKLAKVFDVDCGHQRIDSVHIRSNMRKLGRIAIFSRTIVKFLVNLKRHHRTLFDEIAADVIDRYWTKKAQAVFSMVKPTEAEKTLQVVSADLYDLIEQFKDQPAVCSMHSYKLMQRVLADQCNISDEAAGEKVTVKKPGEIASSSVQNPSDPDATYDGHKGQGYQVQIMETYSRGEDEDEKQQALNLITHVDVQSACESDAHALVPAIADTKVRGVGPDEVVADTAYGSDANHQAAAVAEVDLVAPTQKGNEEKPLSTFAFNEKGYVTACPAGHKPEAAKYKRKTDRFSAAFSPDLCHRCPHLGNCPVKAGKKKNYLRYSGKRYRLAVRRNMERTEAFTDAYRWRAGVEATMSEYDRLTGAKKLRVRGKQAVRFCAKMKAAGLNLLRAARVRRARMKAREASNGFNQHIGAVFLLFKERIRAKMPSFGGFTSTSSTMPMAA